MRPTITLYIVFATLLMGGHVEFALADSPVAPTADFQGSHSANTPASNSGAIETGSVVPALQGKTPDCEGTVPSSTGIVTALLSRIVRHPGNAPGKQCPIPPVPDHHVSQEPHE